MQIHQLKPKHKLKKRKRVGRGGKRGTYSGKGQKGQKARAGRKMMPAIRELIKRYPKLRGYRFKIDQRNIAIVNIEDLEKSFKKDETVSPETLLEKKLIRRIKGKIPKVKILGKGELTKVLIIKNCQLSESAKRKTQSAKPQLKT